MKLTARCWRSKKHKSTPNRPATPGGFSLNGFSAWITNQTTAPHSRAGAKRFSIRDLTALEDLHHQGIASALIEEIKTIAQGMTITTHDRPNRDDQGRNHQGLEELAATTLGAK
ncbi:MAG: hypothetical protein Q4F13_13620 [Pseudomonadota bacterium]|nr:hypothetical protein [Pseudomonadota bacterium]